MENMHIFHVMKSTESWKTPLTGHAWLRVVAGMLEPESIFVYLVYHCTQASEPIFYKGSTK
jgi:hypothetical protein